MIISRCVDAFISDVTLPKYANLIPEWYKEVVGAKSFVMLPLMHEEKLIGMIYGDYEKPQTEAPAGLAQGEMLEWRNRLIDAIRSGSKSRAA